jgi:multidrug transporter EmrE-like cation transporter
VKAIDSLGMVITSIASIYLFDSSLNTQDIIGMVMVIAGVLGLSF